MSNGASASNALSKSSFFESSIGSYEWFCPSSGFPLDGTESSKSSTSSGSARVGADGRAHG